MKKDKINLLDEDIQHKVFSSDHKYRSLVGESFGYLTVLQEIIFKDSKNKSRKKYFCRCVCGVEKFISQGYIRENVGQSCGCKTVWPTGRSPTNKKSHEQFLKDCHTKDTAGKYDYSKVEYRTATDKVSISCRDCGHNFMQTPTHHLSGEGCPSCARRGFNPSKTGFIYVLACGEMVKVGITNKSAEYRAKSISKSLGREFKVVSEIELAGSFCSDLETAFLRYLRKHYKSPDTRFDGCTETFLGISAEDVVEMMECLV